MGTASAPESADDLQAAIQSSLDAIALAFSPKSCNVTRNLEPLMSAPSCVSPVVPTEDVELPANPDASAQQAAVQERSGPAERVPAPVVPEGSSDARIRACVAAVQATQFEVAALRDRYDVALHRYLGPDTVGSRTVTWSDDSEALAVRCGTLGGHEVSIALRFAILDGSAVCFWTPASPVSDAVLIEDWLQANLRSPDGAVVPRYAAATFEAALASVPRPEGADGGTAALEASIEPFTPTQQRHLRRTALTIERVYGIDPRDAVREIAAFYGAMPYALRPMLTHNTPLDLAMQWTSPAVVAKFTFEEATERYQALKKEAAWNEAA